MAIDSIQSHPKVKPADIPLEKLAASKALTDEQKTAEMTRQFEAVLVRQILTQAQKPAVPSKFNSTGVSNSIYQDMMVNQMADTISASRSLGLAKELEKQLNHQISHKAPADLPHKPWSEKTSSDKNAAPSPPIHLTKAPRL